MTNRPRDGGSLTHADETTLALRVHGGRTKKARIAARNELVERHAGIVYRLAPIYRRPWLRDDLIQEGIVGLMRAAELFRPGRQRFGAYAKRRVRVSMRDCIRESRIIHIPNHAYQLLRRDEADLTPEERDAAEAARRLSGDGAFVPYGAVEPVWEDLSEVDDGDPTPAISALDTLPERQRIVVEGRILGQRTFADLGRDLGISGNGASKLEKLGLKKLRGSLGAG